MNQVRKFLRRIAEYFQPIEYDSHTFYHYLFRSNYYSSFKYTIRGYWLDLKALKRNIQHKYWPKPKSAPVPRWGIELHDLEAEYGQTIVDMAMLMDEHNYYESPNDYEKLEKLGNIHKQIMNRQLKQIGVNKRQQPFLTERFDLEMNDDDRCVYCGALVACEVWCECPYCKYDEEHEYDFG